MSTKEKILHESTDWYFTRKEKEGIFLAMGKYADQETKELKQEWEKDKSSLQYHSKQLQIVINQRDTLQDQLTEANALIEEFIELLVKIDHRFDLKTYSGKVAEAHVKHLQYKTKQTTQEVKP